MIQSVINYFLHKWFKVRGSKKERARKLMFCGIILGIIMSVVDCIVPHNRTILEPITIFIGISCSAAYVLLSFGNCLIVQKRKVPFGIVVVSTILISIMAIMSLISDIVLKPDGSATVIWLYGTIMMVALLRNRIHERRNNDHED